MVGSTAVREPANKPQLRSRASIGGSVVLIIDCKATVAERKNALEVLIGLKAESRIIQK